MYTRRHILKIGLAASAALLASRFQGLSAPPQTADVVIIGAGVSGLAAASRLHANGMSVIVLEARERTGGRIWTLPWANGSHVDLGAFFIHHAEESPISELCRTHGIATVETPLDDAVMFNRTGRRLSPAETEGAIAQFVFILGALDQYAQMQKQLGSPDMRLSQAIATVLASLPGMTSEQRDLFELTVSWYIRTAWGAEPENLSFYATLEGTEIGQEDRAFPGGYGQVIDVLAEGIDIRTSHIVQEIDYRSQTVAVHTNSGTFTAPKVIVTLPVGVLRRGNVLFTPALPADKRQALLGATPGVVNKLFLEFPSRFWDRDPVLLMAASNPANQWPVFVNFAPVIDRPVLMGFLSGNVGIQSEQLSDQQLSTQAVTHLRKLYGSRNVPNPVSVARTRWAADPYAQGSYPHFPFGSVYEDRATLARPLDQRLYFAGDGTRGGDAEVRGAYSSGLRAADEILNN